MRKNFLNMPALAAFWIAAAHAGPAESVVLAAMRVSEQPSYAWTSSVQDDARAYVVEGKTQRNGYTAVTLPMIERVAERLGRDRDTHIEAIFKGAERCVIRVGDSWKTVRELPRAQKQNDDYVVVASSPAHAFGGAFGHDPFDPMFQSMIVMPTGRTNEGDRPFCNARLAVAHPHEELALIVSSLAALEVSGQTATGMLTDVGARLLLAPGDDEIGTPLLAAGRFKLWIQDNLVTRYQLVLEGVMLVGRKKILVRQTSDTSLKDIGRAEPAVPDEARRKLEE